MRSAILGAIGLWPITLVATLVLGLVLFASATAAEPDKPKDMGGFLDSINISGKVAVMEGTTVIWDGKPASWFDIPDEGTEVIEITIDFKRKMILRVVYRTLKEV